MTGKRREDIVVFVISREAQCAQCGCELLPGNMMRLENEKPLCLDCADLGHLEFLPRGDTAITRRATKSSPLRAVVVRWSRTRNRYERQGILASPAAIRQAEEECLKDADIRERRRLQASVRREAEDIEYVQSVAEAIREHFPGCPPAEARQIAEHACQKYSGRVGRSAAAKQFDAQAIRLAVIAHIRHAHTDYDRLLAACGDRSLARSQIQGKIERVLSQWELPGRA